MSETSIAKDLAIHLRTIHFALLVLCISIFVSIFFTDKSRIQRASEQLDFLSTLFSQRLDLVVSLSPIEDKLLPIRTSSINCALPFTGQPLNIASAHTLSSQQVHQPRNWTWLLDIGFPFFTRDENPNLTYVIDFMGKLGRARLVEITGCANTPPYYLGKEFERHPHRSFPGVKTWDEMPQTDGFMAIDGELVQVYSAPTSDSDGMNVFGIPLQYRYLERNALGILLNDVYEQHLGRSPPDASSLDSVPFNLYFSELAAESEDLEMLPLSTLQHILHRQERKEGTALSILGASIPAYVAKQIGLLLVVIVQFYFLLHSAELRRRINTVSREDAVWSVAWIGIYDDWLAHLSLAASIYLPVAIAIAVLYFGWTESSVRIELLGYVTGAALTLLLAILNHQELARLRANMRARLQVHDTPLPENNHSPKTPT